MLIGIPTEIKNNENRVAATPAGVAELVAHGHEVIVQAGAGEGSSFPDSEYAAAGARIVEDATTVGALALLWTHPWVAFGLAMAVTVTVLLLMWWLWRKLTRLHHHLRDAFHGKPAIEADSGGDQSSAA